ncbi:MAG TPA: hypothetical protein VEY71_11365 [Chitinophagales bacterium]|nr:hypothetical protein [Chitinophagales bacterium]
MIKLIKRHLHLWPEWLSLPAFTLLLMVSYHVLYAVMGDGAGFIDPSKLQRLPFVFITMVAFNAFIFLGKKFNWCGLYKWYKDVFIDNVNDLTSWQKAQLLVALYLGSLACCCWLATSYAQ